MKIISQSCLSSPVRKTFQLFPRISLAFTNPGINSPCNTHAEQFWCLSLQYLWRSLTVSQMLVWLYVLIMCHWLLISLLSKTDGLQKLSDTRIPVPLCTVFVSASFYLHNSVLRVFQTRSQGTLLPPVCEYPSTHVAHFASRLANESSLGYGNDTRSTHYYIQHTKFLSSKWHCIKRRCLLLPVFPIYWRALMVGSSHFPQDHPESPLLGAYLFQLSLGGAYMAAWATF